MDLNFDTSLEREKNITNNVVTLQGELTPSSGAIVVEGETHQTTADPQQGNRTQLGGDIGWFSRF